MDKVHILRDFTGWALGVIANNAIEATCSHLPLDEEYWLALRHPAEVGAVGMALLARNNPGFAALTVAEKEATWREFRAYVRQAEGFYRGACVLPWKSSPLNYYYSFMNLAKAMAVARGALPPLLGQQPRRLFHGLSAKVLPGTGKPDVWELTAQNLPCIFPQLYQFVIGKPIAENTKLDARDLLNYVSSISWQLGKSGYGPRRWYACYRVIAKTTAPAEYWDILVVPNEAQLDQLPASFASEYQEVSTDAAKDFAFRILKLHAIQANSFYFLERKKPLQAPQAGFADTGALERSLKAAAPYCVFENLDSTEFQMALGIPYRGIGSDIPMNEFIASYAIMFFLSSLVRYHPDYMDAIGESSDAWLIESFAKSAPLFLLRYLVAGVLGYTLIIESA